jgi:acetyl-CoA C-acetyltransferase
MIVSDNTPILIGAGEFSERLDDADYQGQANIELAAQACREAIADTATDEIAQHIDVIAAVRTFEDSSAAFAGPFGKAKNFPRAIAELININPEQAIWDVSGGQSPQRLVIELAEKIAAGSFNVGLITGAEAISTARHFKSEGLTPDWSVATDGPVEERGAGLAGIVTFYMMQNQLTAAPAVYGLFDNARRGKLGLTEDQYRLDMGKLFAPFTKVAANNPHAMSKAEFSAEEIATISAENRMIASPYTRRMVARDQVNQSAALIITSVGKAREFGVPEDKWVYLHGYAETTERMLHEREDMAQSPAAALAAKTALINAETSADQMRFFDLYSCFPAPVYNICDELGIAFDDPRGLTVTGGLPFFGGAGNNYSMHAIAEMIRKLRREPGSKGFVGANGGFMSKYAAAIYSTEPRAFVPFSSKALQREINSWPVPDMSFDADGEATIETYTVIYTKGVASSLIVVGRLKHNNARFIATSQPDDKETLEQFMAEEPLAKTIFVKKVAEGNRFAFSQARLDALFPEVEPAFAASYEYMSLKRDGHVLEVTIDRPKVKNCLHPPAHEEMDNIFNAFYADPELWVCILTGKGTEAFCTGNDLKWSAAGKAVHLPNSGFGGLTTRENRNKPIIAAVNGYAMGGGLEICLACDLVVADSEARLALSEVKVGLYAGAGGLIRLPRQIPEKVATEMILTGRRVGAEEAKSLGLVNRVAPAGQALEAARELAGEIIDGSPTSVRVSMEIMNEGKRIADTDTAARIRFERQSSYCFTSDDMQEGLNAFVEKRKPKWKNR